MSAGETWRPVFEYEGFYEVSDQGRVRSLARMITRRARGTYLKPARLLVPFLRFGYPGVNLSVDGVRAFRPVHVMVCEAWHGPRPEGLQCRHLDDVPTHNTPENLAWGTAGENAGDKLRNGRNFEANKTHCRHGHEFDTWNTLRRNNGNRVCRTCMITYHRERRARIREAARA